MHFNLFNTLDNYLFHMLLYLNKPYNSTYQIIFNLKLNNLLLTLHFPFRQDLSTIKALHSNEQDLFLLNLVIEDNYIVNLIHVSSILILRKINSLFQQAKSLFIITIITQELIVAIIIIMVFRIIID